MIKKIAGVSAMAVKDFIRLEVTDYKGTEVILHIDEDGLAQMNELLKSDKIEEL